MKSRVDATCLQHEAATLFHNGISICDLAVLQRLAEGEAFAAQGEQVGSRGSEAMLCSR